MKGFVDEYQNKNTNLQKCVAEGNTNKFLQAQEISRLKERFEDIYQKYEKLKEQIGDPESLEEPSEESKKQVRFHEEFEANLIDVK